MPNAILALGLFGLIASGDAVPETADGVYHMVAPAQTPAQTYVILAAHEGGRGGPPPGKGPSSGADHHDDHDDSHDPGHDDDGGHDDESHDDDRAEGHDDGKRGPRYMGGRGVADLKSGFGHRFDSEAVIFRH